jgi:acetyl-CoA synthetase
MAIDINFLSPVLQQEFNAIIADPFTSMDKKVSLWIKISKSFKIPSDFSTLYEVYLSLYKNEKIPIAWMPDENSIRNSNTEKLMQELNCSSYNELHQWSVKNRGEFWERTISTLEIKFQKKYSTILNLSNGAEDPVWLEGASMNIVESCFLQDKNKVAIIQGTEESDQTKFFTYGELEKLVNQIASGLLHFGFKPGDAILIYMPFTIESVAAYLGIVKAGMVVVSVADSFSPAELKKRIEMTKAKSIVTCDAYIYGGKQLQVFPKIAEADAPMAIICNYCNTANLRKDKKDVLFEDLLRDKKADFYFTAPDTTTNILFSSGTTKEPKSIPWTHLTPIKCAADAFYHQDIKQEDVVTWTTGMGWMMAPWLIYASFINKATMAIFTGAATTEKFGKFAEEVGVTVLGTIPSVVKVWTNNNFLEKFNWKVRIFSSTGEPSHAEDYFYLMALAKFRAPVIEYCGGTEIGGGYITGSPVQPASPATFTTAALGLNFYLLNENNEVVKSGEPGEVFIVPPSIGLTQKLLNKDHHVEYYENTPKGPQAELLRKHGDAFESFEVLGTTFYKSVGRIDDAMNLGGIKVSAVEIEEVLNRYPHIFETAAISIPSQGSGPEKLVIYYILKEKNITADLLKKELQAMLTKELNPLFRISEIIEINILPRTASNKLMRRELRKSYLNT